MSTKFSVSLLLVAVPLALSGTATAQGPAAMFAGCTHCHGTPDPAVPGDSDWIKRVASTACIVPPAPKSADERAALIAWLNAEERVRPRIERAPRRREEGEGRVASNIARGSVLLGPKGPVGDASVRVRLVWNGETGKRALRNVPAGEWEVKGYRVLLEDDDGVPWQIWGSGHRGRRFSVKAGETFKLDLDLAVRVTARARRARGKLSVGVGVTGDSKMGLTVVKAGDRVPAGYTLVRGDRRRSGSLEYG